MLLFSSNSDEEEAPASHLAAARLASKVWRKQPCGLYLRGGSLVFSVARFFVMSETCSPFW